MKAERLAAQKDIHQKEKEAKANKNKLPEKPKPVRDGVGKYISGGLL